MTTILHIASSSNLHNSVSREIGAATVAALKEAHAGVKVIARDRKPDDVYSVRLVCFQEAADAVKPVEEKAAIVVPEPPVARDEPKQMSDRERIIRRVLFGVKGHL